MPGLELYYREHPYDRVNKSIFTFIYNINYIRQHNTLGSNSFGLELAKDRSMHCFC